ncbi:CPBP family intramembrane glutamic endopeptidase [Roseateles chitinivorans]|uniref:CPBP family intramembrane glutamic endopeptidase n=1 Tax=Roseateles chitinivorans TaxID=2917965 RepID=UPI003D673A78
MLMRRKLSALARALVGLYLVGNVTYRSSQWFWEVVIGLNTIHVPLAASILKSILDLLIMSVLFGPAFFGVLQGHRGRWHAVSLGALIAIGIVMAMLLGTACGQITWSALHMRGLQWIYLLGFSCYAAVAEELICRFLVLDRLGQVVGTVAAFLLQVLIFVYLHMFGPRLNAQTASHLAFGAVLIGAFYLWSESLLGAMALHLTYDLLVIPLFGGTLDDLAIYPIVSGDNYANAYSHRAAATFMLAVSSWLLWKVWRRRRRPGAPLPLI